MGPLGNSQVLRKTIDIIFLVSAVKLKIAQFRSKKHPHCHFERQREIFSNQDSSSFSLLGMTAAKVSKIILNIVEFLGSRFWDGKEKSSSIGLFTKPSRKGLDDAG